MFCLQSFFMKMSAIHANHRTFKALVVFISPRFGTIKEEI